MILACLRARYQTVQIADIAQLVLLLLICHARRRRCCLICRLCVCNLLLIALEIDLIALNVHAVEVFHVRALVLILAVCPVVELRQHLLYLVEIRVVHLLADRLRIR